MERDRFCKPSRLITAYSSKPFLMTPIHLERQYVTSRKNLDGMPADARAELCTVTVRWMGRPALDELFLVATDVCALINIRKSNTAKTVAQFSDVEKVSMPVHCSSGKGSSTHILTVLTMAGVRRLLTSSRSVLSSALLDYLNRITLHIHAYPHYVPVNDPTKPSVTPSLGHKGDITHPLPSISASTPSVSLLVPLSASSSSDPSSPHTVAAVKAEAITPARAWESRSSPPPQILHASSLPSPLPALPRSFLSPPLPPQPPASSPALTRTLSSTRKQPRGKRDASVHPAHGKRMKEEVKVASPPSAEVEQVREVMEEVSGMMGRGGGGGGGGGCEEGGEAIGFYRAFHSHPHAHHLHSQSPPPHPPPSFHPLPSYQTQSPTLSSASSPYFGAAIPLVPSMTLSPTFGPLTGSPSFPTLDYSGGGGGSHYYATAPLTSSPTPLFAPSSAYYEPMRQRRPASPQGRHAAYKYQPITQHMPSSGPYMGQAQYGGGRAMGAGRQYAQQQVQPSYGGEVQGSASSQPALHAQPHARSSPHQSPHEHSRVRPSSAGSGMQQPSQSASHFGS